MNTFALPRKLVIYGLAIPLALLLGYLMASPGDFMSVGVVGILLGVLSIPLFLRWHHPLLVVCWNMTVVLAFLPGTPSIWMLMAVISFGVSIVNYAMDKKHGLQIVPSLAIPLLLLFAVVLITTKMHGGVGLHALGGGTYGGKKVMNILFTILGFFGLSSQKIPAEKVQKYTAMYWLSGLTWAASNLIYMAGPTFWFLFYFFPTESALYQAWDDFTATGDQMWRIAGFSFAGVAVYNFMFMRYGIAGILDFRHPLRILTFVAMLVIGSLGGYRSALVIPGLVIIIQFYFERLYRTRLLMVALLVGVMAASIVIPFASHMPRSIQRTLSFLPLDVSPEVRIAAQSSIEWRVNMWKALWPEVPKYFWFGKGYGFDGTTLYLTEQAIIRGLAKDWEWAAVSGDYHNGFLSIMIPLGFFGLVGFFWFCYASTRWLYRQYRDGPESLKGINTFLLSYFIARFIFFFVGFGSLFSDLAIFVGVVGLSIAINGCKRSQEDALEPIKSQSFLDTRAAAFSR